MKLGIVIPYYNNNEICEKKFKLLMEVISKQLNGDMILYIYEDGQYSEWLDDYLLVPNIYIDGFISNKGVSYARNRGINYLINIVDYILFIDSDDMIDSNYLKLMLNSLDNKYDIIESRFFINDKIKQYDVNGIRTGSCGMAIKTKFIGDIRYDETLLIGEDTKFMLDLMSNKKYVKKLVNTNYYYNLGVNVNSLTMKNMRKEIRIDMIYKED